MPRKVFISYSRHDAELARRVVQFLLSEQYIVWWDEEILSGEALREAIDRELEAADVVLSIWTERSVNSKWVISEAEHADRIGKLVMVRTKSLELWRIPKPFNTYHCDLLDDHSSILTSLRRRAATPGDSQAEQARLRAQGWLEIPIGDSQGNAVQWLKPGSGKTEWFKDIPSAPEMVVVPAGAFLMGSPWLEIVALSEQFGPEAAAVIVSEGPQHKVTITRPFAISRFPITRGEFAAFIDETGYTVKGKAYSATKMVHTGIWGSFFRSNKARSWASPDFLQTDRHPVTCVNWHDAKAFVSWLATKSGKSYQLPSEAQWEYAARAETTTPYWWGYSITTNQANYDGSGGSKKESDGSYRKRTLPVDSFEPNPWGLYQVHGNVSEWCEDAWHENYDGAPRREGVWEYSKETSLAARIQRIFNPPLVDTSKFRVLRGGCWYSDAAPLRSASRSACDPALRLNVQGFRVVRKL
jgi:formylglycine-generating enzyme required for sulfatase activity